MDILLRIHEGLSRIENLCVQSLFFVREQEQEWRRNQGEVDHLLASVCGLSGNILAAKSLPQPPPPPAQLYDTEDIPHTTEEWKRACRLMEADWRDGWEKAQRALQTGEQGQFTFPTVATYLAQFRRMEGDMNPTTALERLRERLRVSRTVGR